MKKSISMLITVIMCVTLIFTACAPAQEAEPSQSVTESEEATEPEPTEQPSEETEPTEEASETRIITDTLGYEVEIPTEINRVVIAGLTPLVSIYCMAMESTDKLVGIDPSAQAEAVNSILNRAYPELADIPSGFIVDYAINTEELIMLEPDVVLNHGQIPEYYDACVAAGIPCVNFSTTIYEDENYNPVKTANDWIELIGEVMGTETNSEGIVAYASEIEASIMEKAAEIPEEDKENVLMLTNYADKTITASGQSFSKYWVLTVGGNYLTDDQTAFSAEVDMEYIYGKNPDVIYLGSFSPYTPEDFYNNTAGEGHDWSTVKAVQDGRVYKFPMGTYHWYPPSADSSLALLWMATTMYPEVYADYDLDTEIKEYFMDNFEITVSDEDLQQIYYPTGDYAW